MSPSTVARLVLSIFLLLGSAELAAETIYTWTDEQGIKRFSNQPPETDADVETIPSVPPPTDDGARESYLRMMQEVDRELRQREIEAQREAADRAEAEKQRIDAQRQAKIEAERQDLQQQINELNQRALSQYFTQGMRQNLIDEIQKKIDALEAD